MFRNLSLCASSVVFLALINPQAVVAQSSLQQVASGLSSPLFVTHAPDETNRVFLLEQGSGGTARIKAMNLSSGVVSTYMTLTGLQTGGERGLLGLAFHPDFATNGYFYVNVSVSGQTRIRRYTANGDPSTSTTGNTGSLQEVLRFNQPFSNHNGGWIGFNPAVNPSDPQYLYIASGDGGSFDDPQNNGQDITNKLLGKMLRIDVDGDDFPATSTQNYAVPSSNPFVGVTGDDEIWAYGLRNPFRNSFDRNSGDLWIADVGQGTREEIDWQPAGSAGGENYGWRVKEGDNCFDNSQTGGNPPCSDPSLVDPVYDYGHNGGSFGGFSVTGGYVYEGSVDRFDGQYFFGDYVTNHIWSIDPYAVDVEASVRNRDGILPENVGAVDGIASFGEDGNGEMYVVSHVSPSSTTGRIYRVSSTARIAEWDGTNVVGTAGDGSTWGSADNWTRDGNVDTNFVSHDTVVFRPGSSPAIDLGGDRTVSAASFEGDYRLSGGTLTVLSGNITAMAGVTAAIDGPLLAESADHSIRKRGAGRLNANSTAPQVAVLEGIFGGTGTFDYVTVYPGATAAPGESTGIMTVAQNYVQQAGAALEMELGGTAAGTEHDQLVASIAATLAGDLNLLTVNGYDLAVRGTVDDFTLVDGGQIAGTFDEVTYDGETLTALGPVGTDGSFQSHAGEGLFQTVMYTGTSVEFQNYFALGGDANGDGVVDASDFNIWNQHKFTAGTDWLSGDFNGDGATDVEDFNLWNLNKFTSVDVSTVPEPTGVFLLAIGAAFLLGGRRRSM